MDIDTILEQKWVLPVATGIVGLAVGFTGGFIMGKNYRSDDERQESMLNHPTVITNGEFDPEFAQTLVDLSEPIDLEPVTIPEGTELVIGSRTISDIVVTDPENGAVTATVTEDVNIFDQTMEWDQEAENANRDSGEPYVISVDEYMENDNDWTQKTVTYYAGDEMVGNDDDSPMYDYAIRLGELKFGHGTNDPNCVYIRDERRRIEYEVIRHTGKFEQEVLGLTIEHEYEEADLKHSNMPRFRDD